GLFRVVTVPVTEQLAAQGAASKADDDGLDVLLSRTACSLQGCEGAMRPPQDSGALDDLVALRTRGTTHFAWRSTAGGRDTIVHPAMGADGRVAPAASAVSPPDVSGRSPALAVLPDGRATVAYVTASGELAVRTSTGDASWSKPDLLAPRGAEHPS